MTGFYVGRCSECNAPNAAAVLEYADSDDIKEMVDSGLHVEIEYHARLSVKACGHEKGK